MSCSYETKIGSLYPRAFQSRLRAHPGADEWLLKKFLYLGNSTETGYNWQNLSKVAREPAEGARSQIDVPAGSAVEVRQIVGYCGPFTVRTEAVMSEERLSPENEDCEALDYFEAVANCSGIEIEVSIMIG